MNVFLWELNMYPFLFFSVPQCNHREKSAHLNILTILFPTYCIKILIVFVQFTLRDFSICSCNLPELKTKTKKIILFAEMERDTKQTR